MKLPQYTLVTGGAKRVGREVCLVLAGAKHNILIHCNKSYEEAILLQSDIVSKGVLCEICVGDLLQEKISEELFFDLDNRNIEVNNIVNNASMFEKDDIFAEEDNLLNEHMRVNYLTPLGLIVEFVKRFPQETKGSIVNIIDQRVLRPEPSFLSYSLSRNALHSATILLAQRLAPKIRVNAVCPGPTIKSVRQSDHDFESQCHAMPLGLGTSPRQVAEAVNYLMRTDSMTGQSLVLDGGRFLEWRYHPDLMSLE